MITNCWPELIEAKLPDLLNEVDLLRFQARTLDAMARILNSVKDVRAQPEVGTLCRSSTF